MSTADIAIISENLVILAGIAAGVIVALAYRKQARIAAPQKEEQAAQVPQQPAANEPIPPVSSISPRGEAA